MTTEAKREAIARIIDPDAWHETLPSDGCGLYWMDRRAKARAKADAILALSEQPQVSDSFEVANQLGSYVGPDTEPELAAFLLAQSEAAAAMGYELERLRNDASQVSDDTVRVPRAELERIASCKIIATRHPEHGPVICWDFDVNEAARKLLTASHPKPATCPECGDTSPLAECGTCGRNHPKPEPVETQPEASRSPASEPQALSEERARRALAAAIWPEREISEAVAWVREREALGSRATLPFDLAIRAMSRFATETQKGSGE